MDLDELIMLAAASLRASSSGDYSREQAVKEAKLLWAEVLKQAKED